MKIDTDKLMTELADLDKWADERSKDDSFSTGMQCATMRLRAFIIAEMTNEKTDNQKDD